MLLLLTTCSTGLMASAQTRSHGADIRSRELPQQINGVLFSVSDSTVAAGNPIVFFLEAPSNCTPGAPPSLEVTTVAVRMGDGFTLVGGGGSQLAGCAQSPFQLGIQIAYTYRVPGTENATAYVTYGDGHTVASNWVTVVVTGAVPDLVPILQSWLSGLLLLTAATLAVWVILWRRLPSSPPLPPGKV
jgi:hypothetical protein